MEAKNSNLEFNWKGLLSAVATLAFLMSGFFWLGYWTGERNASLYPQAVKIESSATAPSPKDHDSSSQPEKPEVEVEAFEPTPGHWVNL